MAEENLQERTEEPTPKRREDARKKGDVPRSRELTMTGVMLAGASSLLLFSGPWVNQLTQGFSNGLQINRTQAFDSAYTIQAFGTVAGEIMSAFLPLAGILIAAVFLSSLATGGWSFSFQAVKPKFERISPLKGVKRIFSANSLNELVKAVVKFALIAAIAVAWLWYCVDNILGLGRQPIHAAVARGFEICGVSLLLVSSGLILIAAVDVPFQLWQYKKKLRMTRQQVKDELKETEGKPEVKSRLRQMQQQVATRRMMEEVPSADVVITNPTHYAVALKYDEFSMDAPKVVAKGKDLVAARIREIATHHNVPLFSAPPLARALHRNADVGAPIPAKLYAAVAQVLAYLYRLDESLSNGQQPPEPPQPEVIEDEL
ncbi:MAG: flagellar biosynthesis protein FlhB [Pseudomonadota bacterium]